MKIDVQHLYAGKLYIDSDEESSVSVKGSKVSIRGKSHNDLKNQETEAKLALGTIITPLNEFDEYDFFRQVIGNISKLGQALQMLVSQLQKHQVEQLTEILQRKRVALINYPTQTDVRKVVKAKHKAKS
jgi:ribosomal protein L29